MKLPGTTKLASIDLRDRPEWSECELSIKAFEEAWHRGDSPRIDDFLRCEPSFRRELLLELVHADLEFRLKAGDGARVESYFNEYPELTFDRPTVLGLIHTEFEVRRRNESISVEEYRKRFPQYSEDLVACMTWADAETSAADTQVVYPTIPAAWPEVPGFVILSELGRGGMGIVYRAFDLTLQRQVALKFLPAEYTQDRTRLERFQREARTASALNHPHICTIHGLAEQDGRPYIVMEFIEGNTLAGLISRRPSVEEALEIIAQAARALAAAHAAGVVHRDIKPENIMVRADGYVKVLDFGLARRLPTLLEGDPVIDGDTNPGTMLGTVAYMSPEQARGAAAESASDIFSLGIVLYQLVTGSHPFEAGSAVGMLTSIATRHPLAPSRLNPAVWKQLEGTIEAMLCKEPRLRPVAADVEAAIASARSVGHRQASGASRARPIVHRESELGVLRAALAEAESERGSIVCVAGEPGIGKTTLVADFLSELNTRDQTCFIASGGCSERLAETEAYLPVIDALENLLRSDTSGSVGRLMSVVAPTWHELLTPAKHSAAVNSPSRAPSQQAMLREFCALLEAANRQSAVVLFFDDVHWADVSTVDLLAHLGQHCQRLRVLVIVTYRPTELLLHSHPFYRVKLELQGRGVCSELPLGFLVQSEIERFLSLLFPSHRFPPDFADELYRRTEGSPLFVADLLSYLRERGAIAQIDDVWTLTRELTDVRGELPESVRSMIQRKLERLDEGDRRLLAAAAVQGHEFDSGVIAATLRLDAVEVEERLQRLERVHNLVRLLREEEFDDHTLTLRYAFVHVLYQQALYNELSPSRRAGLAAELARTLEGLVHDKGSTAAELACLFEVGREYHAAARHYWRATEYAARVFAHHESIALAQRGLHLLKSLPDAQPTDLEIRLQTALGLQLQITKGYAAPEARTAYERARELCSRSPEASLEFPVLWGLWLCHKVRSELSEAQVIAQELFALARGSNDPGLALQAHQALAMTALCCGQQPSALRNIEQVAALYDPHRHRAHSATFGQDPGVICKAFGAVALWLLGYPDTARQQGEQAIDMSEGQSPTTEAVAVHFSSMVHQMRGDSATARYCAERTITISAQHGLSFWLAGGRILRGWAVAQGDSPADGLDHLRQGISDWRSTRSVTYETYFLGLLAEAYLRCEQIDAAQATIEEALALVERTGERFYEAELYRLRGEVALLTADGTNSSARHHAEDDFRRSLEVAHTQEAKSLELRAAISLARLAQRFDALQSGKTTLETAYSSFTEGFATRDLLDARALLHGMRRP